MPFNEAVASTLSPQQMDRIQVNQKLFLFIHYSVLLTMHYLLTQTPNFLFTYSYENNLMLHVI